jgi:hypothetical protein
MPIHRVTCAECGLAATHISCAKRGVTSFSEFSAGARCGLGNAAIALGASPMTPVVQCPNLQEAIAQAIKESDETQAPQRS